MTGINREERNLWIFLTLFAAAVAFGLGALFMYVRQPVLHPARPLPVRISSVLPMQPSTATEADTDQTAMSNTMARLRDAFAKHSAETSEALVSRINANALGSGVKPCPFSWQNGEAALEMHEDQDGHLSITKTIATCVNSINQAK